MEQMEQISRIAAGFEDTTVFLTGGTGFIGKLFLEKLLRMSKTVKVLILVRPKKGKDTLTRFQEIFDGPNMVPMKVKNPKFSKQIHLVNGDCVEKDLGLSEEDKHTLIQEVNFVIHCAATVRLDQDLKTAAYINVRAVKDLIAMARKMKKLRGFLHVSTAFSCCLQDEIDEKFYEPGMKGEDLLHIVEAMNPERLTAITPSLLMDWPNTYVFTKAISEDLLKRESGYLPIAVLRPSIVIASKTEPVTGWIDNLYGVTGAFVAGGVGFMRVFPMNVDKKTDIIPADYVTNAGFAVLWDISERRSLNENSEVPSEERDDQVPIFNVVSSVECPITWGHAHQLVQKMANKIPTVMLIWYPIAFVSSNIQLCAIIAFFLETIPAYLVDALCYCIGKEQMMVKGYQKLNKFTKIVSQFSTREWKFKNDNLQALWRKLEPEDRRLYPFSMKNFDWTDYVYFYVRGVRVYLLKDPLDTVPKGRTKFRLLTILHFTFVAVIGALSLALLKFFVYFECAYIGVKTESKILIHHYSVSRTMEGGNHTRESRGIFADDMEQMEQISKIAAGFEDTTVFLTGGTGFIGKLFLEKLLRMSKTVKVLILVRPKKGKDTLTRFQEIFDGPNMVPMKVKNPKFSKQIHLVNGDCVEKDLGLSEEDKQMLIQEVNYVIHCAATVRFDQELKTAARINVRAVRDLIAMAKKMKKLRGFLHISTAYSFCPQEEIDEKFYEPGMKGEDLLHMVETMNPERLKAITPSLIKDWPNTYAFTKAIAEDLLKRAAGNLPIAVLRPSIVISSKAEPVAGWIDNFYGVTGAFVAGGLGVMRVFPMKVGNKTDIIPADYVTNAGFAVLWDISERRSLNWNAELPREEKDEEVPIFNVVSSVESPITWGQFHQLGEKMGRKIPTEMQIWYPVAFVSSNLQLCAIMAFLLQTIPAYLVDAVCYCIGKEPMMVKGYEKLNKFTNVITYFSTREWKFKNDNLQALWRKLEPEDRRLYPFSMKNFDWTNYVYFYVRGIRVYLLKDPLDTVPKGKTKFWLLTILHFTVVALLGALGLVLLHFLFKRLV
ncbi:uncharacterized protein LOC123321154 [Coccinella septempunctata]|uniref:uncharacterized protein LOC123321154 n=1 Tax=Coccinella septempunctata TaxID=41139 RepID=UPI001D07676B|nr:uncharacterized protein LOC123321154 [Coccinella septempunctata]